MLKIRNFGSGFFILFTQEILCEITAYITSHKIGGSAMGRNEERIAIYSRKSKFTGKGESIGNQVELCKE